MEATKARVIVIPPLGGTEREVAEFFAPAPLLSNMYLSKTWSPVSTTWSPDGRWVITSAGASAGTASAIWMFSADGAERRQITVPAVGLSDFYPELSPDGRTLAFVRGSVALTSALYVLPLTPDLKPIGEPRRLASANDVIAGLAWTVDGAGIVFSSSRGGAQALWQAALSGSPSHRLSVGENGIFHAISARTKRLIYSQSVTDSNIWRLNLRDRSEPGVPLLASTRVDNNPSYSPDGKRIAFESSRSGNQEVWVADADGSNAVQLVHMGRSGSPRWSPDGQRIAFDSNVPGNFQIYSVSSRGGRPEQMTNSPGANARPSWSHDGKWIYFGSTQSGSWQIWKVPSGGGGPQQVTRSGGQTAFESPDGKTLYYTKLSSTPCPLWKMASGGGEESQVVESITTASFAVTHGGAYFVSWPRIQYFDFFTGQSTTVLMLQKYTEIGLSVSPDERWLLYIQNDQAVSDLMLVENFR